jgi:hypothetical protein
MSIKETAGDNNSTRVLSPLYAGGRYLRAQRTYLPRRAFGQERWYGESSVSRQVAEGRIGTSYPLPSVVA